MYNNNKFYIQANLTNYTSYKRIYEYKNIQMGFKQKNK